MEHTRYGNGVRVPLNARFIEILHESKIFSHQHYGVQRWKPGDFMCFLPRTSLEPYCAIYRGEFMNPIGAYSYMTIPVIGSYQLELSTGRYCSIGGGLRVLGNAHPTMSLSSSPAFYNMNESWIRAYMEDNALVGGPFVKFSPAKGVPVIGNDVWIGGDVVLNQAVRIGNGAVIAANSHVTRDVPDYAIVGGNPAQLIRYRFSSEIIAELLEIQFWRFSLKDMLQFNMQDVERFILEFRAAESQLTPWHPEKVNLWQTWRDSTSSS